MPNKFVTLSRNVLKKLTNSESNVIVRFQLCGTPIDQHCGGAAENVNKMSLVSRKIRQDELKMRILSTIPAERYHLATTYCGIPYQSSRVGSHRGQFITNSHLSRNGSETGTVFKAWQKIVSRQMGRRGPHRLGVDIDDTNGCTHRSAFLRNNSSYRKDRGRGLAG